MTLFFGEGLVHIVLLLLQDGFFNGVTPWPSLAPMGCPAEVSL